MDNVQRGDIIGSDAAGPMDSNGCLETLADLFAHLEATYPSEPSTGGWKAAKDDSGNDSAPLRRATPLVEMYWWGML